MRLWQILNMNVGFFGIQFGFGLQQGFMSPIYKYLGADDASLPLLWLAGPVTGLLIQPLIGALSDRTTSRFGRRTPYFVVGAILCSACLVVLPNSGTLWMAAGLLWVLDAAANLAMEPYRAFVNDRLPAAQHAAGFMVQSAFTGLSQTAAYLMPSILVMFGMHADRNNAHGIPVSVEVAFLVGAAVSVVTIAWSVGTTRESPALPDATQPVSAWAAVIDVYTALRDMPATMRRLGGMMFFQWYAMFCYWQYIALSLSRTLYGTTSAHDPRFIEATLLSGRIGGAYNFVAFIMAFAMLPLLHRVGPSRLHAAALLLGGLGIAAVPAITTPWLLILPMIGLGIAWASMMGNPYAMLASSIPRERAGVYMGIFNTFIVVPMLIQVLTVRVFYRLLGNDPRHILLLSGAALCVAAVMAWRMRDPVAYAA
jgi:maltose/moltooligosaccharide transporter